MAGPNSEPIVDREGGNTPSTTRQGGTDLTVEIVADIVAHPYRRGILTALDADGEPVYGKPMMLREIAIQIAMNETGFKRENVPDERVEDIYTSLYHVHAPKLADWEIIDYDPDEDIVTPTKQSSSIKRSFRPIMEAFSAETDSWESP